MLQISKEDWGLHYQNLKDSVEKLDDLLIELRWRVEPGVTKQRVDGALLLSREIGSLLRSMAF